MSQFLAKMLRATRLISSCGRWPGQQLIRGANAQDRPRASASRPLRWPGQLRISAVRDDRRS